MRGTTSGAWAAMIVGSEAGYPDAGWIQALPKQFWLSGVQMVFFASLSAAASYVIVSLCTLDVGIYCWPDSWWANWWFFNLIFAAVTGGIATVWFLIGCFRDLHALFRRLSAT